MSLRNLLNGAYALTHPSPCYMRMKTTHCNCKTKYISIYFFQPSPVSNESKDRASWGRGLEFLMSCISMSVGLGNVWRFPFIAYENGGGAFLIPYICVLIFIGKPMYYLEMILGQFSSKSSIEVWCICPFLKGVGVGQMLGTISIITYYSSLLALTLYYFGVSFQSTLPWAYCKPEYGPDCLSSSLSNDPALQINNSSGLRSSSEYFFL